MLSRLVITFLPRSKRLLISWLQSPSAVILEPPAKTHGTWFQGLIKLRFLMSQHRKNSVGDKVIGKKWIYSDTERESSNVLILTKLESRLLGEISITSDMRMTPPLWQKV